MSVNVVVALHSEPIGIDPGVGLVLDLTQGRLPAVLHWGADLGDLGPGDLDALLTGSIPPLAHNLVDVPRRLTLLPEAWTGWTGRPGLSGSRDGRDWSPKFQVSAARLAGRDLDPPPDEGPRTPPELVEGPQTPPANAP